MMPGRVQIVVARGAKIRFYLWLLTRPKVVRRLGMKYVPWKQYRHKRTGQTMYPVAYSEDGTIRANCWQECCPRFTAVQVFGLSPDDFEEIA